MAMTICRMCFKEDIELSPSIRICRECIIKNTGALNSILEIHRRWRGGVGLPAKPPRAEEGLRCNLCVNNCVIPNGGKGFCGIIKNKDGALRHIYDSFEKAYLHYYFDPIPTNCVAAHVCPASTGVGYPKYAVKRSAEHGFYNLAIFFAGCNLDCLFCQNIEHKYMLKRGLGYGGLFSIKHMVSEAMNEKITCICYFGGDPTPHSIYAVKLSSTILKKARERDSIKRICWETNGLENPNIFKKMALLSMESGGIVKIDWKAYTPEIYTALTGIDGYAAVRRIKKNIENLKNLEDKDMDIPLLVVSTLIVPHYVTSEEVAGIAQYLSSIDEEIPYVLLAFAPHHLMKDTPTTSYSHMMECVKAARDNGLKNIQIGNIWLLR